MAVRDSAWCFPGRIAPPPVMVRFDHRPRTEQFLLFGRPVEADIDAGRGVNSQVVTHNVGDNLKSHHTSPVGITTWQRKEVDDLTGVESAVPYGAPPRRRPPPPERPAQKERRRKEVTRPSDGRHGLATDSPDEKAATERTLPPRAPEARWRIGLLAFPEILAKLHQ